MAAARGMALWGDAFRAMDTDVDVMVDASTVPTAAHARVRRTFEDAEQSFSRFRSDSLLSRLNAGASVTDSVLASVCRLAIQSWEMTGGLFNPMVQTALAEAGYSVTFDRVEGGRPRAQDVPSPARCLSLTGDTVRLSAGSIDLGGIVKGWTVDRAIEEVSRTLPNLLVNAGGDLRCAGVEPGLTGWLLAIDGPFGSRPAWSGTMTGALATSTTLLRRWTAAGGLEAHHLIDPRTGVPAVSPFVQVSAWAPETWLAEVWAKAALIGGPPAIARALDWVAGLLSVSAGGTVEIHGAVPGPSPGPSKSG